MNAIPQGAYNVCNISTYICSKGCRISMTFWLKNQDNLSISDTPFLTIN